MSVRILRGKGIELPAIETEDGLTAKDIMDKIRSFYHRWEKKSDEFAEAEFLELMFNYPKSMCSRHMTDTLKQLVTIIYLDSKPEHEKIKDKIEIKKLERQLHTQQLDYNSRRNVEDRISSLKNQDYWPGYSYDDLAVIFDLSKATVHESVRQKKIEIKQLLEKPNLRKEARALALEELKQEEKLKLLHEKPKGN